MVYWVKRFMGDERGQTTTEYVLILAVVVMISMRFRSTFAEQIERITRTLMGKIEGEMDFPR